MTCFCILSAHHEKGYVNSEKNWLAFMHLINAFDKVFVEYAAIDVDRYAADYVATNNI